MNANNMKQKSGNDSKNYQVAGNLIIGYPYSEIKEIVKDLFEQNFYKLSSSAKNIAEARVNELMEGYFKKLSNEDTVDLNIISDPRFQCSLYEAQKEYAKSGDTNLKEELINILLEKTKSNNPKKKDIILDEIINILPKISEKDKDFLTLKFIFGYKFFDLLNLKNFNNHINESMIFFHEKFKSKEFKENLEYLEYNRCILTMEGVKEWNNLEHIFSKTYTGFFSLGFSKEEFEENIKENIDNYKNIVMPSLKYNNKFQFRFLRSTDLEDFLLKNNMIEKKERLINLFSKTISPELEIKSNLENINIKMKDFIEYWDNKNTSFKFYRLTPLGKIISILNYNNKVKSKISIEDSMSFI